MSKDVKLLAKNLSQKAKDLGIKLNHSQSLELLSFTKGFKDWNSYSASLNKEDNEKKIKSHFDLPFQMGIIQLCLKNEEFCSDLINFFINNKIISQFKLFEDIYLDKIFHIIAKLKEDYNVMPNEEKITNQFKTFSLIENKKLNEMMNNILLLPQADLNFYAKEINQYIIKIKLHHSMEKSQDLWEQNPLDAHDFLNHSLKDIKKIHVNPHKEMVDLKLLNNCLDIVNTLYLLDDGLSSKKLAQVSNIMKEDVDTIYSYFEEAHKYKEKIIQEECRVFFQTFQKNNLHVFHFILNEEQFYVVAHTIKEAEHFLRTGSSSIGEENITSLIYKSELSFDELNTSIISQEDIPAEAEETFLQFLSHCKDDNVPYILAQTMWN